MFDLSSLIESSRIINSSLHLPVILKKVTEISKNILLAEAGSLMLLDDSKKNLVFTVALGKKGHKLRKGVAIKLGQGIAGTVAKTGKPIIVNDVTKDIRFFAYVDKYSGFITHSIMCVPLKVKRKIIGVLEAVNSHRKTGFTKKDLDIFQAFACQVAVAIDNAKMHKEELQLQKMSHELEIAKQIQQSLLPGIPQIPGAKINAKNIPAEQVGGDLYDFIRLNDGKIGVVISDISGKGIPAALYMVRVMTEFRSIVKYEEDIGKTFGRLNCFLTDNSVLGMFVTFFYLVIDKAAKKITYCSAGHLPAVYLTAGKIEFLDKAQNPPLGIAPSIEYKIGGRDFSVGDSILLYTDGAIEARDKKGEEFSEKRLVDAFLRGIKTDALDEIIASLKSHTGGMPPRDDCTLVSIQL